ncbi:hypothetical protein [Helicobacter bilis]|uniref:Uncharacterized protein n=1 Tax=Helicobacter bilis WiWa TaxID=1235804 RepID=N2BKS2_9HELI|nr:hypothetical protein [Helicobacter bilis]EMZ40831.1 hypothetical protein C826_00665 [Helicobacter bilis WiWa]
MNDKLKTYLRHTNAKSTIAADFTPSKRADSIYQSEAALEEEFIAKLQSQGYEYAKITNGADLDLILD